MKKLNLLLFSIAILISCTEEQRAKSFGGTATINLIKNTKLVNVTWKEGDDLWILTRKMKVNEKADTLEFFKHSGKVIKWTGEGKVVFIESKN
jgi:hypothetical protein